MAVVAQVLASLLAGRLEATPDNDIDGKTEGCWVSPSCSRLCVRTVPAMITTGGLSSLLVDAVIAPM